MTISLRMQCILVKMCCLMSNPVTFIVNSLLFRSLDLAQVPQCPQREGMVACRYRDVDPPGSGSVLGYISSDIVEEERGGALVLTYTNGDCSNGRRGVVHVHFLCGDSVVSVWCCLSSSIGQ